MPEAITFKGDRYVWWQCGNCGSWNACPEIVWQKQQELGGYHHCHAGHQWGWDKGKRQRELEQLRQDRDRLKQNEAYLESQIRERDAQIADERHKRERIEKRAGAGVCPCCNRTFTQLARHMQNKHPDTPFVPAVKKVAPVRPARKEAT